MAPLAAARYVRDCIDFLAIPTAHSGPPVRVRNQMAAGDGHDRNVNVYPDYAATAADIDALVTALQQAGARSVETDIMTTDRGRRFVVRGRF